LKVDEKEEQKEEEKESSSNNQNDDLSHSDMKMLLQYLRNKIEN
jgi:hypothetical protein